MVAEVVVGVVRGVLRAVGVFVGMARLGMVVGVHGSVVVPVEASHGDLLRSTQSPPIRRCQTGLGGHKVAGQVVAAVRA
jgi:hypothetical protein